MEAEGRDVKVKSVEDAIDSSRAPSLGKNRVLYARVAFFYHQYTLKQIEAMPYRDVHLLLDTANKIEAERMHNYTMIASAPQSKNGKGVKVLLEHFRKILKG